MNKLIWASAAALAFAAPAIAQDVAVTPSGDVYVLTQVQEGVYNAWPVDRQQAYTAWPNAAKAYYWTLSDPQQAGWWMLTTEQRQALLAMQPDARAQAWESIAQQMAAHEQATAAETVSGPDTARVTSGGMVQAVPAPKAGEYPPCKGAVQDSCVNPREAGLNYGNRPLKHWPGRPASEIPGKKPQN